MFKLPNPIKFFQQVEDGVIGTAHMFGVLDLDSCNRPTEGPLKAAYDVVNALGVTPEAAFQRVQKRNRALNLRDPYTDHLANRCTR